MAVDFPRRHLKALRKHKRVESSSPSNTYQALVDLYGFMARRTESKFNKTVAYRLLRSNRMRAPLSVARLARFHNADKPTEILCATATITDDPRLLELPKMTVCALRFTETARKHIEKYGGECLTFDQLALQRPTGAGCRIVRGPTKSREAEKYFGQAAGLPGSHTKPRDCVKSHK